MDEKVGKAANDHPDRGHWNLIGAAQKGRRLQEPTRNSWGGDVGLPRENGVPAFTRRSQGKGTGRTTGMGL